MPPRARTAGRQAPTRETGVFARLKAEASKDQTAVEPYVIDDVEPPIVIQAPTDTDTQIGLAEVFGEDGAFDIRDAKRIIQLICGDSFEQVWELFRKEHISVLVRLIADMADHFGDAMTEGANVPGGSRASSS